MLLRALLAALVAFAASAALLKASVVYENYFLLGGGFVVALVAIALGMRRSDAVAA